MKKRVFLDEDIDPSIADVFGRHAHIHTAGSLGILGKDDTAVISAAIEKCCLIITANQDFLEYYRNHPRRKQGRFFYGLIFLSEQKGFGQRRQLKIALREFAWKNNRQFDGLIAVRKDGKVCREILCCSEHAKAFEVQEAYRRKTEGIGSSKHAPLRVLHTKKAS